MNKRLIIYIKRYIILCIGVFLVSFGIVLTSKANLGVAPIASPPFVESHITPLTMGTFMSLQQFGFFTAEVLIERKEFKPFQFLQLPVSFLIGMFTDLTMKILAPVSPTLYVTKWIFVVMGVVVLAFGIFLELQAKMTPVPADAIVHLIAKKRGVETGRIKNIVDGCFVAGALILCAVFVHKLIGVREGTIFVMIFTGRLLKFYNVRFGKRFERAICKFTKEDYEVTQ